MDLRRPRSGSIIFREMVDAQHRLTSDCPRVPEGTRVYAVGDIHGRSDLLTRLLRAIEEDGANGPARRVLVLLGDYVDRGAESRQVLDILLQGMPVGFVVVPLMGNHEDLMLEFLDGDPHGAVWLPNGGLATLKSYGVDVMMGPSISAAVSGSLRQRFADAISDAHVRLLRSLRFFHEEGDYLFVHAGVRPEVPLDRQDPHDLMWIRREFLNWEEPLGRVVVHGHTIREEPELRSNRIGIDTGAYRSERLTALVLEGSERRFIQT